MPRQRVLAQLFEIHPLIITLNLLRRFACNSRNSLKASRYIYVRKENNVELESNYVPVSDMPVCLLSIPCVGLIE